MQLTLEQKALVEQNLLLVHKFLHSKKSGSRVGIYSYDDLYQIGCVGLCKAAAGYRQGSVPFEGYAWIVVRNEIYHALEYASFRKKHEKLDANAGADRAAATDKSDLQANELYAALRNAKKRLPECAQKGVEAMILRAKGKTSSEIGAIYGVSANLVTAWVSKARKQLMKDPEFCQYLCKET